MGVARLLLPQQDCHEKMIDLRRCARKVVRIPTTVADESRFSTGVVTNISEGGCELRDVSCDWSPLPFFPSQYLTLRLYPLDGPSALQITLAEIRWVERELAGVEFVNLSQEDKAKLQRLCSKQGAHTLGDEMPTMLREAKGSGITVAGGPPHNQSNFHSPEVR